MSEKYGYTREFKPFKMSDLLEGTIPVVVPDNPLTLGNIVERFPVIERVFNIAYYFKPHSLENRHVMYSNLKCIASEFVGWESPDENYASERAYDLVIDKIIDLLGI